MQPHPICIYVVVENSGTQTLNPLHIVQGSGQLGVETPNEPNRLTYIPFMGHPRTKVLGEPNLLPELRKWIWEIWGKI